MSLAAVSRELGVHRSTVEGALHRQGVTLSPRGAGKLRKATASQAAEAVEMYKMGYGCEDVAAAFSVTSGAVLRWVREAGLEVRPKGFGRGENHHAWSGGHIVRGGYVLVLIREDDPMYCMSQAKADGVRYVLEHRLVMARHLGRPLSPSETVHHVDGDRMNNDISNLQLRQGRHGKGVVLCCAECGSSNLVERPLS